MEEMNVTVITPSDRSYRIYREMCEILNKRVEEAPITQFDAITILTGVGIKILCSLDTARDANMGLRIFRAKLRERINETFKEQDREQ